jgi:hypothetical protein
MQREAEGIAPATQGHSPSNKVSPSLFDLIVRGLTGLIELDFVVWGEREQTPELVSVVADDTEQAGDSLIKVVVDLDRHLRLVEQD